MTAAELYKAGQLKEAIEAQIQEVKAKPADHARRLFLFELLLFSGDLDRARRQVEALSYDEPPLQAAAVQYRQLIDSEMARRRVWNGEQPTLLADPPEHLRLRLEALKAIREQRLADAIKALDEAHALVPPLTGHLNGKEFSEIRDADDLFSAVLEVMTKGNYFWVPLDQVRSISTNPPKYPRDLLYLPARIELRDDSTGEVFLPTLYYGSHLHADDAVKLGRMTDWKAEPGGPTLGLGLRTFLVDDGDATLLEWRQLELDEPAPPPPPSGEAGA